MDSRGNPGGEPAGNSPRRDVPPRPVGPLPVDPLIDDPDPLRDDPDDERTTANAGPATGSSEGNEGVTRLLRIVERLTEICAETPESEVAMAEVASEVARYTASELAVISLADASTNELETVATHGFGDDPPRELAFIGDGIHGWVLKIGTPMVIGRSEQSGGLPLLPFEKAGLIAAPLQVGSERLGSISVIRPQRPGGYREDDLLLLSMVGSIVGGAIGHARSVLRGQEAVRKAIESLTLALDARDPYTRGHSQRVAIYSLAIANELEREGRHSFAKELRNSLLMSALLHDVGKIGIRDEVLLKPGKLTEEEYELIKTHPEKGAEIVRMIPGFDENVIEGILHHHERWDGKGYPNGQARDKIHIFGRVIGLADTFDAIVTSRPYKTSESFEFARSRVEELSGSAFDPEVVQAMMRAFRDRNVWNELGQISTARPESETVQAEVKGVDTADRTLKKIFGRNVTDLPTLPHVVSQVLEKTRNSDANLEEVVRLISTDQGLVSTYLKLVNSAFYGFSRRITTLKQAITLLGFRSVRNVVVNAGVAGIFRRRSFNSHYRNRLWDHSVTTAVAARVLAPHVGYKSKEEAFTAGLLHDIGKVVIDQYAPKVSAQILRRVETGEMARDLEQQLLGADHTQIGAWISERWHLPKSLCAVIEHHHDWQKPGLPGEPELIKIVAAANDIAKVRRTDDRDALAREIEGFAESPGNVFGFDVGTIAKLLVEIWTSKTDAMKTFGAGQPVQPAEPAGDEGVAAASAPGPADVATAARRARGWRE